MEVELIDGKWEITGVPEVGNCGPYGTKQEAEADKRGLERFYKYENVPGFVTTDRRNNAKE